MFRTAMIVLVDPFEDCDFLNKFDVTVWTSVGVMFIWICQLLLASLVIQTVEMTALLE